MKRHEIDVFSMVSGLVFVAVAAVYIIAAANDTTIQGRWVIPLALIGLGVGGLVGSVVKARRNGRPAVADGPTDHSEALVAPSDEGGVTTPTEPITDAPTEPISTGRDDIGTRSE